MKRLTMILGIVTALMLIDGLGMQLSRYRWPEDQSTLFGNQNIVLSDGQEALLCAGISAIATVIVWVIAVRRGSAASRDRSASGT